ncbi:unnamed protein product [Timema podura]|uniref:Carboxylesterase type B domain-containing protein n=1 Tax=Timema podura TaxID=61482 RepID=A0ABN7PK23_TIMPD|nr:unnamed protein product [Timema podura]
MYVKKSNNYSLFKQAISESGSVLDPFSYAKSTYEKAFKLAQILGFNTSDVNELVKFLKKAPADELVLHQMETLSKERRLKQTALSQREAKSRRVKQTCKAKSKKKAGIHLCIRSYARALVNAHSIKKESVATVKSISRLSSSSCPVRGEISGNKSRTSKRSDCSKFSDVSFVRARSACSVRLEYSAQESSRQLRPFVTTLEFEEQEGEEVFLPGEPSRLLDAGKFQKVPYITGINDAEGKGFVTGR